MRKSLMRSAKARAGYTLVEVMLAMAILAIGATGIMSLQQASIRGNQEANSMGTATRISQMWLDRFRLDALNWRQGGVGVVPVAATFANTRYMRGMPAAGGTGWFAPVAASAAGLPDAVLLGYNGNPTAGGTIHYCTQTQLNWVRPGTTIRADVRVYWRRRQWTAVGTEVCPVAPDRIDFHMVQASTLLRYTPAGPTP
jgi:type IV pilus assembly protein PilV